MPLPTNFSGLPGEEIRHYFRNLCIDFRKAVKDKDRGEIEQQMQRFIDASRQIDWHHKTSGAFHKDAAEKAAGKVFNECKRFIADLAAKPAEANSRYLLEALTIIEEMVERLKIA